MGIKILLAAVLAVGLMGCEASSHGHNNSVSDTSSCACGGKRVPNGDWATYAGAASNMKKVCANGNWILQGSCAGPDCPALQCN